MARSVATSVMNFLNEVAERYPHAISLAAGRPGSRLFDAIDSDAMRRWLDTFRGATPLRSVMQYGRTAGLAHEVIACQIMNDDGVATSADRTIVTAGCQEALALCLPALCDEPGDTLLVRNPAYIGITGAAASTGVRLHPLDGSLPEIAAQIEHASDMLASSGRRARAVYLVPDFDNPTGEVISLSEREAILKVCAERRIVVLEDNPYGMFRYEGDAVPPMASLDSEGCVVYLSTYSKTIAPALRVGALTLPETLFGSLKARRDLAEALTERKSFITVNTSQVCQAIVGGLLMERDCSLRTWVAPSVEEYRRNRSVMLDSLSRHFAATETAVQWNQPEGGFFLCMNTPVVFDEATVTECATVDGVIVLPMAFFAFDESQATRVRLAFSAIAPDQIDAGVAALARFMARRGVQGDISRLARAG